MSLCFSGLVNEKLPRGRSLDAPRLHFLGPCWVELQEDRGTGAVLAPGNMFWRKAGSPQVSYFINKQTIRCFWKAEVDGVQLPWVVCDLPPHVVLPCLQLLCSLQAAKLLCNYIPRDLNHHN